MKGSKHMDNKVIVGEEDNGYAETLYLSKDPKVRKEILEGKATSIEECISEDDVAVLFDK